MQQLFKISTKNPQKLQKKIPCAVTAEGLGSIWRKVWQKLPVNEVV